ncbi:MAG TPA: hypothetical protein VJ828_04700 [Lacipirellulaceae bacterium]|nr:hypothetical protein [Lacipirellulaceae bacterium]
MSALPPAASPEPGIQSHWLAPIRFGVKPYRQLCHSFDRALAELEARYPAHRRLLTLDGRNKKLQRRPK